MKPTQEVQRCCSLFIYAFSVQLQLAEGVYTFLHFSHLYAVKAYSFLICCEQSVQCLLRSSHLWFSSGRHSDWFTASAKLVLRHFSSCVEGPLWEVFLCRSWPDHQHSSHTAHPFLMCSINALTSQNECTGVYIPVVWATVSIT